MARRQATARVVQFDRYGAADVLEIVETEVPQPGPGEVLVEVVTAGINHIEAFVRAGRFADDIPGSFPQRSGSDFAGIVRAVGEGVTSIKKGADVLGHVATGSHATHLVVPVEQLVVKPESVTWEVAGSLFLAGYVATEIIDSVHITRGETIVVSAAAGGVGSIEAQLAKSLGATVIGTCGQRNFDYLRQIGIKPVVYGDGLADRIRELAPDGVHAFVDNIGQDGRDVAAELGVPESRYRSSDDRKALELAALTGDVESRAHATAQLTRLVGLVESRAVNVLISGFYPFDHVRDAFDDLEKLHARGKIVLGTNPVSSYRQLKARELAEA